MNPSIPRTLPAGRRSTRWMIAVLAAWLAAQTVLAQPRPPRAPPPPRPWHGDIRHFHERDWPVWRSGHWYHGRHAGRIGWWWVAGGLWYFYPAPVYPYPNPYEPPPAMLVTPPAGAAPPPRATYWYFCESAQGYYPYVQTCPEGWQPVNPTPADAASAPSR